MIIKYNNPEKYWDYSNKKRKKIKIKSSFTFGPKKYHLYLLFYYLCYFNIIIIMMQSSIVIAANDTVIKNLTNSSKSPVVLSQQILDISLSSPLPLPPLPSPSPSPSAQPPPQMTTTATATGGTLTTIPEPVTLSKHTQGFDKLVIKSVNIIEQQHQIQSQQHASENDDDYFDGDDEFDEYELLLANKTAKGIYVGGPCERTCDPILQHVYCDEITKTCSCDRAYPVNIGLRKGCAKPKKLGEQCFYDQTCIYTDENSLCIQVRHNALCQCVKGYHSVTYSKPTKRIFCTQDIETLTSDLPTLLGVTTGIAVLAGLICMVLHLFSKTKYPRHRNFADANLPPPIMYSTDTVNSVRPSSRTSLRSSNSIGSYSNRRPSSAPQLDSTKGVLVSSSRTGSRRPSLASVHSTSSSIKSYSMVRFEKELQQKELRQEMKFRLTRLQQQQQYQQQIQLNYQQSKPHIIIGDPLLHGTTQISKSIFQSAATPSPLTPGSTDELLPAVDESQEFFPPLTLRTTNNAYAGPCTSSNEALLD